jgi:hypothetical protein
MDRKYSFKFAPGLPKMKDLVGKPCLMCVEAVTYLPTKFNIANTRKAVTIFQFHWLWTYDEFENSIKLWFIDLGGFDNIEEATLVGVKNSMHDLPTVYN